MVLTAERMAHEQPLSDLAQGDECDNGKREGHAVPTQALYEHLGQGFGRKKVSTRKVVLTGMPRRVMKEGPREAKRTTH